MMPRKRLLRNRRDFLSAIDQAAIRGSHPSLRRKYMQLLKIKGPCDVNQSWFFRRTPGHQPLLVDHWLDECPPAEAPRNSPAGVLEENLDLRTGNPAVLGTWQAPTGR